MRRALEWLRRLGFRRHEKQSAEGSGLSTTVVYDSITGVYIHRVPIYVPGASCKLNGRKHDWVLNAAHRKVCIGCGLVSRAASFYKFAADASLLSPRPAGRPTDRKGGERGGRASRRA